VNYVVDANLSPRLAEFLRDAGHDAVHVRDIGLRTASDDEIIDYAISTDRIVISHDTDKASNTPSNKLGEMNRYRRTRLHPESLRAVEQLARTSAPT
jgi:predicted nuclease of predicted toxin-antitoxin system